MNFNDDVYIDVYSILNDFFNYFKLQNGCVLNDMPMDVAHEWIRFICRADKEDLIVLAFCCQVLKKYVVSFKAGTKLEEKVEYPGHYVRVYTSKELFDNILETKSITDLYNAIKEPKPVKRASR